MTDQQERAKQSDSIWRWWPLFLAGFCAQPLAGLLTGWMPHYVAAGVAFFAMWVCAGILFTISFATRPWADARWTAGAIVGGFIVGALDYIFPR